MAARTARPDLTRSVRRRVGELDSHPALRRCIGVPVEDFTRDHWSRAPLLSTAGQLSGGFDDLLSLADADELLSRRGLRTPFLRIAKNGEVLAPSKYTGSGGAGAAIGDQVHDERVLALFADGGTLVLQALHRLWPPLIDFSAALADDLGHPVQVNAYLTPPQSQGFSSHYDVHDVFVLQLAGTKRWLIHPPVLTEPLRTQPWTDRKAAVAAAATAPPVIDALLAPGDALYLPRGWLHAATAQGEVSAHLTVGIHNLTRYSLVEALLAEAADDPELRRSLPLGVDTGELTEEIDAVVRRLVERLPELPTESAGQRVRRQLWSGVRPVPLAPIAQTAAAAQLTVTARILRRPHLRHGIRDVGDEVEVSLDGRRVRFPGTAAAAVRAALAGPALAVADLPGLAAADQVVLARRLLVEGLVVPCTASSGPAGGQGTSSTAS